MVELGELTALGDGAGSYPSPAVVFSAGLIVVVVSFIDPPRRDAESAVFLKTADTLRLAH